MNLSELPFLSAADIVAAVPYAVAVDALETALREDVDPATDPARSSIELGTGSVLLMPSQAGAYVGVKLASVAPDNPARGLPRIQAVYVLIDADTMAPICLVDGTALTTIRTPAVSALAARHLASERVAHLVVYGSGPQAYGHVEALAAVRPVARVSVVGRDRDRAAALAEHATGLGIPGEVGDAETVRDADVIVCATTSPTPLFDGALVRDDACVLAIGSHEPVHRELDSTLMGRSTIVVEDHDTALREAGDVVLAAADGVIDVATLVPLRDVAKGVTVRRDGPVVFKGTGMAWQDLVVAAAAYRQRVLGDAR